MAAKAQAAVSGWRQQRVADFRREVGEQPTEKHGVAAKLVLQLVLHGRHCRVMRDGEHKAQIVSGEDRPPVAIINARHAHYLALPDYGEVHAGFDPAQQLALTGIQTLVPDKSLAPSHGP